MQQNNLLYSIPQFRELAGGISHSTTYREIRDGRLKITKVGRRSFVSADDAQAWLEMLKRAA